MRVTLQSAQIKNKQLIAALIAFLAIIPVCSEACSMYKITAEGKTMVGCNHDAWLTTSKIWFVNASDSLKYGAAFTGARQVSRNRTTPQSGMNTVGLAFSRLSSFYPKEPNPFNNRIKITDEASYLTSVLQSCATVSDVKRFIQQYDHSFFLHDVFIYVDSTGKYLIVEPYQLIEGYDPHYVLGNYCPSITNNEEARKLDRVKNGQDFLALNPVNPSIAYCTSLSDTMHVSRKRNGDGTLLTSIWDTRKLDVTLYFYHSYDSAVHFSLVDELAKGNHSLDVPNLFPTNADFVRLSEYKTPFNTIELRVLLVILGLLLFINAISLATFLFFKRDTFKAMSNKPIIGVIGLNLLLIPYLVSLITNKGIYYFDAPYFDPSSTLISTSSYIPFILAICTLPIFYFTIKNLSIFLRSNFLITTLISNNLLYLVLISGFVYWGLYAVI